MKKLVFVAALAAFGLLAGGAWADTILNVTPGDVYKQCGNKIGCRDKECGTTKCNYACGKGGCTVTIQIEAPGGGNLGGGGKPSGNR